MSIDFNILITYGGVAKKYKKGEIIFQEEDYSNIYYQILNGKVRMYSTNSEGKELTQGYFYSGESFGEPPMLIDKPLPSTAKATKDSVILKIGKEKFLNILHDFPEIKDELIQGFADRIYQKAKSAQIWACSTPEEKMTLLLQRLKDKDAADGTQLIAYTRQELADMTGLRVETVIRTLIKMQKQKKIKIIEHKIYI